MGRLNFCLLGVAVHSHRDELPYGEGKILSDLKLRLNMCVNRSHCNLLCFLCKL